MSSPQRIPAAQRLIGIALALAGLFAFGLSPVGAASEPTPADDERLIDRPVPPKPAQGSVPAGSSSQFLHLKLSEGSTARLDGADLEGAPAPGVASINTILANGSALTPMFDRPPAALRAEKARLEAATGHEQADKSLWFRVELPPATDAASIIDDLNALGVVEIAYAEPLPPPLPVTPDFEPMQAYLDPAPDGIDADFAGTVAGATGTNVKIIDIEYSWNPNHEDLTKSVGGLIPNGTPCDPFTSNNHGTAVLGELIADDNGFGVTGAIPDADIGMTNAARLEGGSCLWRLAAAIDVAHANLSAGDVILLEQQAFGPGSCLVAAEWVPAHYDAIVAAVADGLIVVAAAGNGGCDTDLPAYGSPFPMGRPDSGSIIVGAGHPPVSGSPARSRQSFSSFGSRVNLQGHGSGVTTTGYGSLQGGPVDEWYTASFNGTSSASPNVAAAAGSLSSVAQQNGSLMTSQQVRSALDATGTPQDTTSPGALSGHIGPLPDLGSALTASFCNGLPVTVDLSLGQSPTANDDVILGTAGPDTIVAGLGNDTVCSLGGDDTVNGGAGNDWVDAGADNDIVFGLDGADTLEGGAGDDQLLGFAGDDILSGGSGADILNGGADNDSLDGGDHNDQLYGQGGDDTADGGSGDDFIIGVDGTDELDGGPGNDVVNGGPGGDTLNGSTGDDVLYGLAGDDTLNGGDDNDSVFGQLGSDTIDGGAGDDALWGNEQDDTITDPSGTNVINGGPDHDTITGGSDDDQIFGDGNLIQAGNDILTGGGGADLLNGFAGNDTINAQDGVADTVNGGPDTDTCTTDIGVDTVYNCP
ncbi:MAG: S8 family serine peptidase [Acidimicrobiales bacterium]